MKCNKVIPQLRFRNYMDKWQGIKLINTFDEIKDTFLGSVKKYYTDKFHGHFYLESNNIKDGKINKNSMVFVNDGFYKSQEKNWLHTGDIIMVQSGAIGDSAVVPKSLNNTASNDIIVITHPKRNINSCFFNDYFQSDYFKKDIRSYAVGNTIKHLSLSDVKRTIVYQPSFTEQRLIGRFFAKLDKLISLQQAKCSLLKKQKRGYLQKLFPKKNESVPRVRFNGFDGRWNRVSINDIATYKNGHSLEKKAVKDGSKIIIDLNSISIDGVLKDSGKRLPNDFQNTLDKNDLVMILSDLAHGNLIGLTAIIPKNDTYALNQRVGLLRFNKSINPVFMHYLLNSIQRYFHRMSAGTSQLNLSKKDILATEIMIPSLREQDAIALLLTDLDNNIDFWDNKFSYIRKLKKAYLQKMFC